MNVNELFSIMDLEIDQDVRDSILQLASEKYGVDITEENWEQFIQLARLIKKANRLLRVHFNGKSLRVI